MDRKEILQRKISYQKLRNRLKECLGFNVIRIIDFEHELVQNYIEDIRKTTRYSWPVYDSTNFSEVFSDNVSWFGETLSFQKVNDEWLLTICQMGIWWMHIQILDYTEVMRELWWKENTSITAVDLSNQIIFDIGTEETTIEVRLNYLKKQSSG